MKKLFTILTLLTLTFIGYSQSDYKIWSDSVIIDAFSGTAALTINGGDVTLTKFVNGTGLVNIVIDKATGTVDTIEVNSADSTILLGGPLPEGCEPQLTNLELRTDNSDFIDTVQLSSRRYAVYYNYDYAHVPSAIVQYVITYNQSGFDVHYWNENLFAVNDSTERIRVQRRTLDRRLLPVDALLTDTIPVIQKIGICGDSVFTINMVPGLTTRILGDTGITNLSDTLIVDIQSDLKEYECDVPDYQTSIDDTLYKDNQMVALTALAALQGWTSEIITDSVDFDDLGDVDGNSIVMGNGQTLETLQGLSATIPVPRDTVCGCIIDGLSTWLYLDSWTNYIGDSTAVAVSYSFIDNEDATNRDSTISVLEIFGEWYDPANLKIPVVGWNRVHSTTLPDPTGNFFTLKSVGGFSVVAQDINQMDSVRVGLVSDTGKVSSVNAMAVQFHFGSCTTQPYSVYWDATTGSYSAAIPSAPPQPTTLYSANAVIGFGRSATISDTLIFTSPTGPTLEMTGFQGELSFYSPSGDFGSEVRVDSVGAYLLTDTTDVAVMGITDVTEGDKGIVQLSRTAGVSKATIDNVQEVYIQSTAQSGSNEFVILEMDADDLPTRLQLFDSDVSEYTMGLLIDQKNNATYGQVEIGSFDRTGAFGAPTQSGRTSIGFTDNRAWIQLRDTLSQHYSLEINENNHTGSTYTGEFAINVVNDQSATLLRDSLSWVIQDGGLTIDNAYVYPQDIQESRNVSYGFKFQTTTGADTINLREGNIYIHKNTVAADSIYLPSDPNDETVLIVKKHNSANDLLLCRGVGDAGERIEGNVSIAITGNYGYRELIFNENDNMWYIIGQ